MTGKISVSVCAVVRARCTSCSESLDTVPVTVTRRTHRAQAASAAASAARTLLGTSRSHQPATAEQRPFERAYFNVFRLVTVNQRKCERSRTHGSGPTSGRVAVGRALTVGQKVRYAWRKIRWRVFSQAPPFLCAFIFTQLPRLRWRELQCPSTHPGADAFAIQGRDCARCAILCCAGVHQFS